MEFDPAWLLLSMIPSGVGFVLIVYGKKQARWPHTIAGLLLTVYPYFTNSITSLIGVGAGIGLGLYYAVQAGW